MLYGGKVLSHFSAEDRRLDDLISVLPVCRFAVFVMDSDLGSATAGLRSSKLRVIDELDRIGGWAWVTNGREIENYFAFSDRSDAIAEVHPSFEAITGSRTRFGKPLEYRSAGKARTADKIKIARYLTGNGCEPQLDWESKTTALARYISNASKELGSKPLALGT